MFKPLKMGRAVFAQIRKWVSRILSTIIVEDSETKRERICNEIFHHVVTDGYYTSISNNPVIFDNTETRNSLLTIIDDVIQNGSIDIRAFGESIEELFEFEVLLPEPIHPPRLSKYNITLSTSYFTSKDNVYVLSLKLVKGGNDMNEERILFGMDTYDIKHYPLIQAKSRHRIHRYVLYDLNNVKI